MKPTFRVSGEGFPHVVAPSEFRESCCVPSAFRIFGIRGFMTLSKMSQQQGWDKKINFFHGQRITPHNFILCRRSWFHQPCINQTVSWLDFCISGQS